MNLQTQCNNVKQRIEWLFLRKNAQYIMMVKNVGVLMEKLIPIHVDYF